MSWVVPPTLITLRAEFDAVAPDRDRGADGTIGDTAHQATSSDHNPDDTAGSHTPHTDTDNVAEVHALDIDSTGPWPRGDTFGNLVSHVLDTCKRLGANSPLAYVIYYRKIFYAPLFVGTTYGGDDPHINHAHFSCKYGAGGGPANPENYTGPWGLIKEYGMPATDITQGAVAAIADANVKRIYADLATPTSGLAQLMAKRDAAIIAKVVTAVTEAISALPARDGTVPVATVVAALRVLAQDVIEIK